MRSPAKPAFVPTAPLRRDSPPGAVRAVAVSAAVAEAERHLGAGRAAEAEAVLRAARTCEPHAPAVNGLLAVLALMGNRPAQALELVELAIRHAPTDARLHFTIGRAHKAAGALDTAVSAYRRAIELDPRFAEAHVSLGIALKALGRIHDAIGCHEAALAIDASLGVAHANLTVARALQRQQRELARADRAEDAGPAEAGDDLPSESDIDSLQRTATLAPANPALHINLAALLQRAGRPMEAAHAFNRALTLNPSNSQSCIRLGHCLAALGDYALASERRPKQSWVLRTLCDAGAFNWDAELGRAAGRALLGHTSAA